MTRKWGSCSKTGTVTFAADLVEQSPRFQDFVVVHEPLHLRVQNHSRLFKSLMSACVPDLLTQDQEFAKPRSLSKPPGTFGASKPPAGRDAAA